MQVRMREKPARHWQQERRQTARQVLTQRDATERCQIFCLFLKNNAEQDAINLRDSFL
jgi:hypothetical protein